MGNLLEFRVSGREVRALFFGWSACREAWLRAISSGVRFSLPELAMEATKPAG